LAFWARLRAAAGGGGLRIEAALAAFDLTALAEVPGRRLSAGQRRRLALARLIAAPAELWLLDEPTVGLDRASLGRLAAALAEHRAGGGRVVAATHAPIELPGAEMLSLEAFAPPPVPDLALTLEEAW